jgi:hypothetical protein
MTSELNIDDLVSGAASGNYPAKLGSKFGAIWGWDGLTSEEATPEQYRAFGAGSGVRLGHGHPVSWLERKWATILTYRREQLVQVNVHTDADEATLRDVRERLDTLAGKSREIRLPQDAAQGVVRRFRWDGRDGEIFVVQTATYLQVSVGQYTGLRRLANRVLRAMGVGG